jgi:hypothetical protein
LPTAEPDAATAVSAVDLETASPPATGKHKSFFRRFSIRGFRGNVRQLFKQHSDEFELSANGSNNGSGVDQTATLDRFAHFAIRQGCRWAITVQMNGKNCRFSR